MEQTKRALAGLWSIPGVGPMAIARLSRLFELSQLADVVISEWLDAAKLPPHVTEDIPRGEKLGELGDEMIDRALRLGMKIAWREAREYPELLAKIPDAPPLLFYLGPGTDAPPRKRVAMVGTRNPDAAFFEQVKELVVATAEAGIGVVSGGARGIDSWAHLICASARGETWAFMGSALDQLDPQPKRLWEQLKPRRGTLWSELPPGVRAEPSTFPRRNRLISGASDAVVVLRAAVPSGCRHTVEYAIEQQRPVLACTAEKDNRYAEYCIKLLQSGAYPCIDVTDIMLRVGQSAAPSHVPKPPTSPGVDVRTLSPDAQVAYAALPLVRGGRCFDDLEAELDLPAGRLVSALFELDFHGLIVEHAGRRFERR